MSYEFEAIYSHFFIIVLNSHIQQFPNLLQASAYMVFIVI